MRYEQVNADEFDEIVKELDYFPTLNIVPIAEVSSTTSEYASKYALLFQDLSDLIVPFTTEVERDKGSGEIVANTIFQGTFGILSLPKEKFLSRISFFIPYDHNDADDEDFINEDAEVIVTVRLIMKDKKTLNKMIAFYISVFSKKRRENMNISDLDKSLVYMEIRDLYYLSRGDVYTFISDDGDECKREVSSGIFYDPDIQTLYTPNHKKKEEPLTVERKESANFPPVTTKFSATTPSFGNEMYNVLQFFADDNIF